MTTLEIKSNLHQKIENISDSKFLEAVLEMIELNDIYAKQSHWDSLSLEDKQAIQDGVDQLNKGELISDEEVRRNLKSKFNFL
jgi:predicted transcriptional regulator